MLRPVVVRQLTPFFIFSLFFSASIGFCASTVAALGEVDLSTYYDDVFCGMPIPAAPAASVVLPPLERSISAPGMLATVNINIVKFSFDPPNPTIYVGDTVTWTNIDGSGHTTTGPGSLWNSGTLANGQSFSFTFNSAGSYTYHCSIHSAMTGNITVLGATPTATPTSSNTPTLGNYPNTSIALSGDTTVIADAAPTLSARMTVSTSAGFKGKLEGDPVTGTVRVTNAHPAGTYGVRVTSYESGGASTTKAFSLNVTTPPVCNPVTFAAAVNFGVGVSPRSVAVGDFNRDGKQDLAVANQTSNNVSILLGNGAGGFSAPANLGTGSTPYSVTVGEFNGDGKQDLVVANEASNNVSILIGDGAGSFAAATNLAAGVNPTAVAVGYFNGDSNQDLAVSHLGATSVSVLLGNGTGGFGALTNYSIGFTSNSITTGDFNLDGRQDLATASQNSDNVSVILGNGTGGFGTAANFSVGQEPASITAADFDGDGKQDLATANDFSNDVSVLLGDGAGGFGAAVNFAAGTGAFSIAAADLNSDGNQDLATANFSAFNVSALIGTGTGSFGTAVNFGAGSQPYAVTVGDFNGDGRQDLAVANRSGGNVSVLVRTCAVSPTPTNTMTSTPTNTPTNTSTATFTPTPANTSTNTPTNTPTPPASISGNVIYGNAIGAPNPRFVSNVLLSGAGSPNVSATSNFPGGGYTLTGFGAGSYTVTPSKTAGQNSITSFDAAKVAQHAAGVALLTANQLVAADVSNNGSVTSFDAGLIGKFVVGAPPFGTTGNWIFSPSNRTYPSVTTSFAGQDYTAFLMGEVSGNWTNTGARQERARRSSMGSEGGPIRSITVSAPNAAVPSNQAIIIPIRVDGAAEKGIISYEFALRYDPSVIEPLAVPVDVEATVSRGLMAIANTNEPGLLRVVVYGPMPINENGLLLNLRFQPVGRPGSGSPLVWETIMFNEGDPEVNSENGRVELISQ